MSLNSLGLIRSNWLFKRRSWPSIRQLSKTMLKTLTTLYRQPSQSRWIESTQVSLIVQVESVRIKAVPLTPQREKPQLYVLIRIQNSETRLVNQLKTLRLSNSWERVFKLSFTLPITMNKTKWSAWRYSSLTRMNTSYLTPKLSSKFHKFS